MTRPRIVDPGATLALSRRTTRRHFLLHPDEAREMEQIYWYCLAHAANLHGVVVHAACLMSTHAHEVITDVHGVYPKFLETFHRNLAVCTKALRGWPEEVFNKRSSGVHALLTPDAVIESIAYLISNPVAAGAVRYAKDWPGAHTLPQHVGTRVIRVKRPTHYFDPGNSEWPEELELRLEMPVALELDYGPELARDRIAERVRDKRHQAWNEAKRTGRSFMGPRRLLKVLHTKRAKSYEVFGSLNPRFSAAGHQGAARQAVKRLRAFKAQYQHALARWMAGDRNACFPEGTWWMRVGHGARCGPAP
ncbi:MAG: transposase [Deltaproteobacteria bacterium]|nr:MAG: transposase [Deltaproteobacteria bacterium]